MNNETIELRVVRMPLVRPFATSQGVTHEREVLLARVIGETEGWGGGTTKQGAIDTAMLDAEGRLRVPSGPGLGVDVDPGVIARFTVSVQVVHRD